MSAGMSKLNDGDGAVNSSDMNTYSPVNGSTMPHLYITLPAPVGTSIDIDTAAFWPTFTTGISIDLIETGVATP